MEHVTQRNVIWEYLWERSFLCGPCRWWRHETIEKLLETAISDGSIPRLYHEDQRDNSQYAKGYTTRGATRFRPVPHIVQYIYKW
jgi:hypothetical protein